MWKLTRLFCIFSVSPRCSSSRCHSSITRQDFGRYFEQVVAESLKKYSFDVTACGGPRDRGIDFRGAWLLKSSPVRVIGQCRRHKRRLGPKHVRELEGTLSHEVKGTLGIIVSESGYSKSAYEVFMGSPYPVVLTALTGYSDDLLQWYFDQESHENNCNKSQDFADCNSYKNVQYPKADDSLPSDIKTLDNYRQNYLKINKMDGTDHEEVEFFHEKSVQQEEERNLVNKDESRGLAESAIFSIPHHYGYSVRTGMDNELLVNKVGKIVRDGEKLTNSDFLDLGQGQFTMFELNPAARKLLPNVVVGLEYRMQNSRTPELFLHEDNSFVNLPDQ